jgi:hypothetical protein
MANKVVGNILHFKVVVGADMRNCRKVIFKKGKYIKDTGMNNDLNGK